MAQSLAAAIVKSSASNPSAFTMVVGIADGSVFSYAEPSWGMPAHIQDKCYIGVHHLCLDPCIVARHDILVGH